eukprot:CAMPEP_0114254112 /NCGR_PEP_ID=MMETSP0058-20121206/16791_1 /TAXON_ID=36894 /ORGANISM="Pyramimonas parkeae, CCMP726" /LENGTH=404 /DNA_ID=CAMNT_0001368281 /DNA_START=45 /DNA_END=1256 /DNA_ORIENTATION=-
MEERAREYLSETVEPILRLVLQKMAVDRPHSPHRYIVEQLQQQKRIEARAQARDAPVEGREEDVREERDSLVDEDDVDLHALLLPHGYLTMDRGKFGVHYNADLFKGWVRQTSPACAAAAVAGAWNGLLPDAKGRRHELALGQADVVQVYQSMIEEQIVGLTARLERLLGGPLDALIAGVVEQFTIQGKTLGGKGEVGVKRSEMIKAVRYVVDGRPQDDSAMQSIAEYFQGVDMDAEKNVKEDDREDEAGDFGDVDDTGSEVDYSKELKTLFHKMGALEKISRSNPSTADFGNWAILQAVARLSAARELPKGIGISASIIAGKKLKGRGQLEIVVSYKDTEEIKSQQWSKLRELFTQENAVLLFHLRNHYALVYALREWAGKGPGDLLTRQILTSRRGQRPSTW